MNLEVNATIYINALLFRHYYSPPTTPPPSFNRADVHFSIHLLEKIEAVAEGRVTTADTNLAHNQSTKYELQLHFFLLSLDNKYLDHK